MQIELENESESEQIGNPLVSRRKGRSETKQYKLSTEKKPRAKYTCNTCDQSGHNNNLKIQVDNSNKENESESEQIGNPLVSRRKGRSETKQYKLSTEKKPRAKYTCNTCDQSGHNSFPDDMDIYRKVGVNTVRIEAEQVNFVEFEFNFNFEVKVDFIVAINLDANFDKRANIEVEANFIVEIGIDDDVTIVSVEIDERPQSIDSLTFKKHASIQYEEPASRKSEFETEESKFESNEIESESNKTESESDKTKFESNKTDESEESKSAEKETETISKFLNNTYFNLMTLII
ncbi:hypothetical protein Glove_149g125 [Diversispora epigaea]|uniref:Uncharacterized protein n=1 Tax=Diversispora epigaea TaxID=1348612 RepID=A0A397J274_9GLOM|nr:hypothetical protein Glove_149g125 [Diversispora epigaea]